MSWPLPPAVLSQPVCPVAHCAVTESTGILTLSGLRKIEDISPGDRLITRSGGHAPVRHIQQRKITCVVVRAYGGWLSRPEHSEDLFLPAERLILVRDPEICTALCCRPFVAAAGALCDGRNARAIGRGALSVYCLRFDRDQVIYAGGLELPVPASPLQP